MKFFKKTYWLIFPFLIVVFMIGSDKLFNINDTLKTLIAIAFAYVLSPKVKMVDKQHGEEEEIKWLFFKKVINKKI